MISWIVRGLLGVGEVMAGWFVAKVAPNFGVIQMSMTLILLTFVVAAPALWPERWSVGLNRLQRSR
jgi:hypothetical protein